MNPAYKLSDEALDEVNGGVARYSNAQLRNAGVSVDHTKGKTTYSTMINGKSQVISEDMAMGMVDCYNVGGGVQLNDQQKKDLMRQSGTRA